MTKTLDTDIRTVRPGMENQDSQDNTQPTQEDIQDVYVLIVREQEADHTHIVDSTTAYYFATTNQANNWTRPPERSTGKRIHHLV